MSLNKIILTNNRVCTSIYKVLTVFIYNINLYLAVRFNRANIILSIVILGRYDNKLLDTFLNLLV